MRQKAAVVEVTPWSWLDRPEEESGRHGLRSRAARFLRTLEKLPPAAQRKAVGQVEARVAVDAFTRLSSAARASTQSGPSVALAAAGAAVRFTQWLEPEALGLHALSTLRAEAWAQLANAQRIAERFEKAETTWRLADCAMEAGDQRGLVGEINRMKARLRRAQHRFTEALELLDQAHAVHQELGDRRGLARVALAKAWVHYYDSQTEKAFAQAFEALDLLDREESPDNVLGAMHLVALCLIDAGKPEYAHDYLKTFDHLYPLAGGMIELRGKWLWARLSMAAQEWSAAAKLLEELRAEFKAQGLDYDAALVTVDLCVCYANNKMSSAVWTLAQEMYPVFLSMKIPRAASAALILFIDAARAHRPRLGELLEMAKALEAVRRRDGR